MNIAIFLIYLTFLLLVGVYFTRKASQDSSNYLLGGRSLGPMVTALTMQSTSMSGYTMMGAPALGFQQGWYALWYAIGDAGGGIVNLSVLGKRMRRLSEILGALSPIEYLAKRYESASVRVIASVISIVFLFAYVVVQFITAGKTLEALTGLPYKWGLILGIGVIIFYTVAGGYLAVVWTDFIQSIIMLIGVLAIFIATLVKVGGLSGLNASLAKIDPSYLSPWGKDYAFYGQWGLILGALIFLVVYMGLPHVVVRHMSMKSTKTVKSAILSVTIYNQIYVFIPYILGFAAIILLPSIVDPEMIIPELAFMLFPPIIAAIILSAIMAAIMSTSDSVLMQAGTILSRDIYQAFINKKASHKEVVFVSRLCILLAGVVGVIMAISQPPSIFGLVIFAVGTMGCSFIAPYIAAVYWKKANSAGALSSMIGGGLTFILWTALDVQDVTALDPFVAGLIVSFLGMYIGSRFGNKPSPAMQDMVEEAKGSRKLPKTIEKNISKDMSPEARTISVFVKDNPPNLSY